MMTFDLSEAIKLRENGKHNESNQVLLELVQVHAEDPAVNYQCAWSYDLLGEEEKAVPFYKKAIELGLSDKDLEGALLGLGSTYRTLGKYQDSKKILLQGVERFPTNQAMKTFLAMTLYNLKEYGAAMEILLKCLVESTMDQDIQAYKKAIAFYSDKLDETWT